MSMFVAEGEGFGFTCRSIDRIDATPGDSITPDQSLTLTPVYDQASGTSSPDMFTWKEGTATVGSTETFTPMMPTAGNHTYTLTASCAMVPNVTTTKSKTITVNPVTVTDISIAKTGGNMVYSTIYVGDTVTFTPTFNPAGHTPDSVTWTLKRNSTLHYADGLPANTTSDVVASGVGNTWSTTLEQHTKDEPYSALGGYYSYNYSIKAEAVSAGQTSTAVATFNADPYEVTGLVKASGGNNEGDTHQYVATTNPGTVVGGTFHWERERTSDWGSSDGLGIASASKVVSYDEIDPGEWKITVTLNSGGYVTTASKSLTIQHARATGYVVTGHECIPEGVDPNLPGMALVVYLMPQSSTGRLADLDYGAGYEKLVFYKADGSVVQPFVSDPPFIQHLNTNPAYVEWVDAFYLGSPNGFWDEYSKTPTVDPIQTGSLKTDQSYYAYYGDSNNPDFQDFFGPVNTIMQYIEDNGLGSLQYRVVSHGKTCTARIND